MENEKKKDHKMRFAEGEILRREPVISIFMQYFFSLSYFARGCNSFIVLLSFSRFHLKV